MTKKERKYVTERVDNEGFDYCFVHYSDFKEIEDEEFHKLREAYLEAQYKLAEYVGCL